jgi:hypothetical protein
MTRKVMETSFNQDRWRHGEDAELDDLWWEDHVLHSNRGMKLGGKLEVAGVTRTVFFPSPSLDGNSIVSGTTYYLSGQLPADMVVSAAATLSLLFHVYDPDATTLSATLHIGASGASKTDVASGVLTLPTLSDKFHSLSTITLTANTRAAGDMWWLAFTPTFGAGTNNILLLGASLSYTASS